MDRFRGGKEEVAKRLGQQGITQRDRPPGKHHIGGTRLEAKGDSLGRHIPPDHHAERDDEAGEGPRGADIEQLAPVEYR